MLIFIDFRRDLALFECPACARFKLALHALIRASSTQSIRATQSKRCRAFYYATFCAVLVKFVKVIRFVATGSFLARCPSDDYRSAVNVRLALSR